MATKGTTTATGDETAASRDVPMRKNSVNNNNSCSQTGDADDNDELCMLQVVRERQAILLVHEIPGHHQSHQDKNRHQLHQQQQQHGGKQVDQDQDNVVINKPNKVVKTVLPPIAEENVGYQNPIIQDGNCIGRIKNTMNISSKHHKEKIISENINHDQTDDNDLCMLKVVRQRQAILLQEDGERSQEKEDATKTSGNKNSDNETNRVGIVKQHHHHHHHHHHHQQQQQQLGSGITAAAAAAAEEEATTTTTASMSTHNAGGRSAATTSSNASIPGAYSGLPGQAHVRNLDPRFSLIGVPASNPALSAWEYSIEMGGHHDDNHDLSALSESGEEWQQAQRVSATADDRTGHLAVANLVADSSSAFLDLPIAKEHHESCHANRDTRRRTKKALVFGGLIAITAIGIALLVVVLRSDKSHADSANANNGSTGSIDASNTTSNTMTGAPTVADLFQSLLPDETQQMIQSVVDSPQAIAYDWTINDPQFTSYANWRKIQRFALATLFFATSGSTWTRNSRWLNYSHHDCEWYTKSTFANEEFFSVTPPYAQFFVSHYSLSPDENFPCTNSSKGRYQHLWLDSLNMEGILPDEVYLLRDLKSLSLGLNPLGGTISTQIGMLTQWEALALYNSGFFGTIPTELYLLTKLSAAIFLSNKLEGTIPENHIAKLSNLRFLMLNTNVLTGTIPTQLGVLTNLISLYLVDNAFHGTVPTELANFPNMTWLSFAANQLHGTLPTELGLLTKMTFFSARANQLTGTLHTELGLWSSLDAFSVRANRFSGTVPTEFGNFKNLMWGMDLGLNMLTGAIPTELGRNKNAGQLNFQNNFLTRTIPSELGLITGLRDFFVQSNHALTGTVPKELSDLASLGILSNFNITETLLSGELPDSVCTVDNNCPLDFV